MNTNFEQCFAWLIAHEGGYVDHPADPGGVTNLGVTQRVYEGFCMEHDFATKDMRDLTEEDVLPIYKQNYWDRVMADKLPAGIDWSVFDWAVNSGTGRAARMLQKHAGVTSDGVIGQQTLKAVYQLDPAETVERLYMRRQAFYERLKTFETFGRGWTKRNNSTREQALSLITT